MIIFHAVAKCLLFLCVGVVEHKLHSRDIESMAGLMVSMPRVSVMMQIGVAGMFLGVSPRILISPYAHRLLRRTCRVLLLPASKTYLNIRGAKDVLRASIWTMASLFTDRAISYRADKGFDHMKVATSVGVQKMVRSDERSFWRHVHRRY